MTGIVETSAKTVMVVGMLGGSVVEDVLVVVVVVAVRGEKITTTRQTKERQGGAPCKCQLPLHIRRQL